MRVLLVPGTGIDPLQGGQGSFCRFLAEGLLELGHEVELAGGPEWTEFCKRQQIPLGKSNAAPSRRVDVIHVNGPGIRRTVSELASRHKVILTHQDHRYICPATTAWTPQGCAQNGSGSPCGNCPSGSAWFRARLALLRTAAGKCCNVAVSSYLLRRLALPNGHAILSPIPLEQGSSGEDAGLVAFAGRLVPEKGVDLLLRAVAKVPDIRLEIAGDGPMLAQLRQIAEELGVAARVRFLGFQSLTAVQDLYRRAAAVCVPSVWHEPFGYTAAEALALGRALIVSNRGALPELVGQTRGWVCRGDDPEDWARTLASVIANREERERRCSEARAFVSAELSPRHVAGRYAELYEQWIGAADRNN